MWRKNLSVLAAALTCLSLTTPPSRARARQEQARAEVVIPGNLTMALELMSPLSTSTNKKNDKFDCKVLSPVEYSGAIVSGHVSKAKSSGKANKQSELDLAFDAITFADGRTGKFDAQVKEVNDVAGAAEGGVADAEGTVRGKSRVKTSVKRAAMGALLGAVIGGAVAGPKGAAAGAAIGAGVGLTTTLAVDGPNLEFASGTQFTVLTNAPPRGKRPTPPPGPAGQVAAASGPTLAARSATPAVAQSATPPAAAAVLPVEAPSSSHRAFRSGAVTLSAPDNWREMQTRSGLLIAPKGAYVNDPQRPGYTHCIITGSVAVAQRMSLQQATEQLVKGFRGTNSYLQQQGGYTSLQLSGRDALSATLAGRWPRTGHAEVATLYTTKLRDGSLFYLITVSPQDDAAIYGPLFDNVVRSVRVAD